MEPKVYLETTIASLLVAKPSRDLIQAADRQTTLGYRRHIAKAMTVERVRGLCARRGFPPPVICTPYDLMLP